MHKADIRQDEKSEKNLKSKIAYFTKAMEVKEEEKPQPDAQKVTAARKLGSKIQKEEKPRPNVRKVTAAQQVGSKIQKSNEILVAAIDVGTTYSEWGFQSYNDFDIEPTTTSAELCVSKFKSLATEKTLSVILIKPDGKTLEAFGYEAVDKYMDLLADKKHKEYYYFKHFKMALGKQLEEKINERLPLEDVIGRTLPAIDVFSLTMKYLLDDMFKEIDKQMEGAIEKSDIRYVITVPAIWTPSAKDFMRKAGERAGIPTDNLSIALEPEAASILCRHLPLTMTRSTTDVSTASFPANTRYIVLDAGGGTIDITVHEVVDKHRLKEVKAARGGGWGGMLVNEAFENLITTIVGLDTYNTFKHENTDDFLVLLRDFEVEKKKVDPDDDSKFVMSIPVSLAEICKRKTGKSLATAVESSDFRTDIHFREKGFKMTFEANVFRTFFDASISKTIQHIEDILDEKVLQIKAILMVGGFSASSMLQKAVKSHFKDIDIIVPSEAVSSIIGAVLCGQLQKHDINPIEQRVLQYTYGVSTNEQFVEGKHPEERRISTDAGFCCKNVFSKHVEKEEVVIVGEPQHEKTYTPVYKTQTAMDFPIYASRIKNPQYTDEDCIYVGKMTVELPDFDGDLHREVLVSLTFSGPEIEVQALDVKRKEKTKAWLEFLG